MSVRVMSLVWQFHPPRCNLILPLALADHAHDDGRHIFPSVGFLSLKTGLSERTIQRGLTALEEVGWLQLVGARKGGRRLGLRRPPGVFLGRPTEWELTREWIASPAPFAFRSEPQIPRQFV